MDWLSTKIDNLLSWFSDAFTAVFSAITTWLKDFFVWVLDSLLSGIAFLLESIPVPSFMQQGLAPLFTSLPQPLVYLLNETGVIQAFAIIGGGVLFNLTRKLLTLGQW
jgi:hypothetical protein